ncbi:MAG: hypothetical protein C0596_04245 [Marinilabiliales bacterium]|nr:MAG: hypothetical protein C0596_04245 [Marinilabiliales bacterium]
MNQSTNQKDLFDLDKLNQMFDNDNNQIIKVIKIAIEVIPQYNSNLKTAINQQNYKEIKFHAHKIKAILLSLGSTNTIQIIKNIEALTEKNSPQSEFLALYKDLEANITKLLKILNMYINNQ